MIQANELRIGNLLTSKSWKGSHSIGGIIRHTKDSYWLIINGYEHKYEEGKYFDLEPIPLDESWLLKAGFENNSLWEKEIEGVNYFKIGISLTSGTVCVLSKLGEMAMLPIRIKTLHHLQNWFYFTTGTELKFNN